ncbi:MAG: CHAT domain-containing tetratricopeptide repeat protein [Caldilineaceae bacterium]
MIATLEKAQLSADELIEALCELTELSSQQQLLTSHVAMLDDTVALLLKQKADHFLRSDVQRSLRCGILLEYLSALTQDDQHCALALLAQANAYALGGLGEYARAVTLYDRAAQLYQANEKIIEQARAQVGKIFSLGFLGRYDEAFATGAWASQIFAEHGEWRRLAELTANLAILHGRRGADAEALALLEESCTYFVRAKQEMEAFLPSIDQNRAIFLRNLGRFEASIAASQRAWKLLDRLGQKAEACRAQQNLALTYFMLGRYNDALELLDKARDIFVADGRLSDALVVDLYISDCLLQLRRFVEVLEKCSNVCQRAAQSGDRFGMGQALLNEAIAYAGLRRYEEALSSIQEAKHCFAQEKNLVWIAYADLERGAVLYRQGDFQESIAVCAHCVDVFALHQLPVKQVQACTMAARSATALGEAEAAYRWVAKAQEIEESHRLPALEYQIHHLLGTLATQTGATAQALAEYEQAIEELEHLRGQMMIEFRAAFLEDKEGIYEDMVELCLTLDRPLTGLAYAERAKSRALLELLASRVDVSLRARHEEDLPLVEEIGQLRAERDRLSRRWESAQGAAHIRASAAPDEALQNRLIALEKEITALWYKLLIRNADYARDAAFWQVHTEPVQHYLAPTEVVVEYFVVHGELVAFLVTAAWVRAYRLPGVLRKSQQVMQLFNLNLKSVLRSTPAQVERLTRNAQGLLQQLYQGLVAPFAQLLEAYDHLIVVPHGQLHYLPFHALYDGQSYLLEKIKLSYLPGSSILRYCTKNKTKGEGMVALGHSFDGLLPYAQQEAQTVASIIGGAAIVDDEATPQRFAEATATCRIVHLAAHGNFRPDNPLFSGIALAGGWLTTLDVFSLRLQASLVTLSACQTGRNVVSGGDELLGLMRAFLNAGAASLVTTLWAVEDRSTARLMETFYQTLMNGATKAEALRQAQLDFALGRGGRPIFGGRVASPQFHCQSASENVVRTLDRVEMDENTRLLYAHPYFWAPFMLVGDAGDL